MKPGAATAGLMARLRRRWSTLGAGTTALFLLARALRRLPGRVRLACFRLVAQPVPVRPRVPSRLRQGYELRRVLPADYDEAWFPRPRWVVEDRFAQGAVCLAAFRAGKPVGCVWLVRDDYVEDVVRCRYRPLPPETTVWDFDVYVAPEYRATRAFLVMWDYAEEYLRGEGVCWSLSRIDAFNVSSLRAHAGLGARPVGSALFLTIGGWQVAMASVTPYVHLSTGAGSMPTLRVPAPAPAREESRESAPGRGPGA